MAEKAVFLSASIPEAPLGKELHIDPFLVREAVCAVVEAVLGRYRLIWGGQPGITPSIWEAAKRYGVSYKDTVTLYQSSYFKGRYPAENTKFDNVVYTKAKFGDREASLAQMRREMISRHNYLGAVFIGGKQGVAEEFQLFRELHPHAKLLLFPAAGGITHQLFHQVDGLPKELLLAVDFSFWAYRHLGIDPFIRRKFSVGHALIE